jgi:peptidoglycan/LPS O-acetylase OafA/YrhL
MRYKELDGLRGIAALSVYFSHLVGVFEIKSSLFNIFSNSPIHFLWHGESAVKLFFLISGFVLTLPYIKNRVDLNVFTFYIKRVFRIYPAYILAILFCICLQSFLFKPSSMSSFSPWINEFWKWKIYDISHVEFINTFILAGAPFNTKLFDPVIGTLRSEMIISIILPFFIFLALRISFFLNILILFLLFFIGKDTLGIFYLGIIMAFFRNNILDFIKNKDTIFHSTFYFLLASTLYTSSFSLCFYGLNKLNLILSVVGCAFFLILAMKNGLFQTILKTRMIQFLGNISYSLYLLHFPVLMIVCSFFSNNNYLITPISLTITLLLSYLSYNFVEIPFMRLGKKILVRKLDFFTNQIFIYLSKPENILTSNFKIKIKKREINNEGNTYSE